MQFQLPLWQAHEKRSEGILRIGSRQLPLCFVVNRKARRYVLRVNRTGAVRVTVPRGGTLKEARRFAERNAAWLEQQLLKLELNPPQAKQWFAGTEILFRGDRLRLETASNGNASSITFGTETLPVQDTGADLRAEVQRHLWVLAARELPCRVQELAGQHGIAVTRVRVANQRSRWGSCSRRGTISLNWRLIQMPEHVRDYIVLHEFAHFREMNHSAGFWREVERLCPEFRESESWLRKNSKLLL